MTGALASDSAPVPPAVLLPCLIVVLGSKMSLVKAGLPQRGRSAGAVVVPPLLGLTILVIWPPPAARQPAGLQASKRRRIT